MRRCLPIIALLLLGAGVAQAALRSDGSKPAPARITRLVSHVPARTLDRVRIGAATAGNAARLSGGSFSSGGKPEVLTVNLAWCPHCAANSWALAVALSRFGRLTGLRVIDTGRTFCTKFHANPCFPHTHGLSFLRAHLKSRYLSLTAVVLQDVKARNLERPTSREATAISSFDPQSALPAVDVGGIYGFIGPAFSPGVLAGKSWSAIASALASGKGQVARSIDGSANVFAAAMCRATGGKPGRVCHSKGVRAAAKKLQR